MFLGSQISVDGDHSHEIKRCLLIGRNTMMKLYSLLKSRDISLLTKVCIVKAIVIPIIIYRCDIWTIRLSTEELVLEKILESPLDCKELEQVIPKGNQS